MPSVDNPRQNGHAIRKFREMRGLDRNDLAKTLGVSYPYLSNVENELKDAATPLIERIALALDVPVKALARRPLHADAEPVPA